jgi:type VI secretion system protein ImpK
MNEEIYTSYILESFEDFYKELIRQKQRALTCPYQDNEDQKVELEAFVMALLLKLQKILETQSLNSLRLGGHIAYHHYTDAQYLMCSIADEIFLNLNWPGKRIWEENLLESKIFQSHTAGETFFSNLDDFLNYPDPIKIDLAILYLVVLGTGFKGKYKDIDDLGRLQAYKNQLFLFIHRKTPELFRGHEKLFKQPYAFTIKSGDQKTIQSPHAWYWAFSAIIAVFFIFSYIMLHFVTIDINSAAQNIIRAAQETD